MFIIGRYNQQCERVLRIEAKKEKARQRREQRRQRRQQQQLQQQQQQQYRTTIVLPFDSDLVTFTVTSER